MNTWNPRQEILAATHRWYWAVLSFLLGVLFAWLVSLIWPTPYRATQDIYVGLNAYRVTREFFVGQGNREQFRNLDDYKNWQMEELNALAFSDAYLAETLALLQAGDPYWQSVDVPTLRSMLSVAWRNTGDWHFSATTDHPEQSEQAVTIWTEVIVEEVGAATEAARQAVLIDSQLTAVSDTQVAAETRQMALLETQALLADAQADLTTLFPDQPLTPLQHWKVLSLVGNITAWTPGWQITLQAAPTKGALPADYATWLEQVNALIEAELALLPDEISALTIEHAELAEVYQQALDESMLLSSALGVGPIKDEAPQITPLRPTGSLLLMGGILGVFVLTVVWAIQITRRTEP